MEFTDALNPAAQRCITETQHSVWRRFDTWLACHYPVVWAARPHLFVVGSMVWSVTICALVFVYKEIWGPTKKSAILIFVGMITIYLPILVSGFKRLFRNSGSPLVYRLANAISNSNLNLGIFAPKWGQIAVVFAARACFLFTFGVTPALADRIATYEFSPTSTLILSIAPVMSIYLSLIWLTSDTAIVMFISWSLASFVIVGAIVFFIEKLVTYSSYADLSLLIQAVYLIWLLVFQLLVIRLPKNTWKLFRLVSIMSLPVVLGVSEFSLRGHVGSVSWVGVAFLLLSIGVLRERFTFWEAMP